MSERILVLSLLRAGDLVVQLPALAALRAQRPDAELHVLVQASAQPAVALARGLAQVHRLPVDHQGGPTEALAPVLSELQALDVSLVVNLTFRPFAAELAERIAPERVVGLACPRGRMRITTPWFSYLNDWGSTAALSVIHYADVFCQAIGRPFTDPGLRERLTAEDQASWAETRVRLGLEQAPFVVLQLSTSEDKKTLPRDLWARLSARLAALVPDVRLLVLAAPNEAAEVATFCREVGALMFPCSLTQAACALADARLLVSGDTALVHLAALVGTQVLLLSCGSSAFRELGPYGPGHWVLQAAFPCAPCRHGPMCLFEQPTYPCARAILPDGAAQIAAALVTGAPHSAPLMGMIAYRSQSDDRGLMTYQAQSQAPPDEACVEVFRAHLVSRLMGPIPQGPTRSRSAPENRCLSSFRQVVSALRARLCGDGSALGTALRQTDSAFVIEFGRAVAERLQEPNGVLGLDETLAGLEAELRATA